MFNTNNNNNTPARFRASAAIQRRAATRFLCVWGLPGVTVTPTIFFQFFPNPSGSLIPRVKILIIIYVAPYGRNFRGVTEEEKISEESWSLESWKGLSR